MAETHSLKFTLRFDQPIKVWVLQLGGWFPIQLTGVGVMLVDRNVTSALAALAQRPDRTDMEAERWWLGKLNDGRYTLNPVLCAFEGRTRSVPSYEEFCAELAAAQEILRRGLPNVRLIEQDPLRLADVYSNVTAITRRHAQEISFLQAVCPLLAFRIAAGAEAETEATILSEACSRGIPGDAMVVLAALSCLYEPQGGEEPRIGRGVLKPKPNYSLGDAYNAVADVRSLLILAAMSGLGAATAGFCTRDKYLAAFWTYLAASNPVWSGNSFSAGIRPRPDLFPRLDEKAVQALMVRLAAFCA